MVFDTLKLTADIVSSYVSMRELTSKELVGKIKVIHAVLSSFDAESVSEKPGRKTIAVGEIKKPSIPFKDIVKAKYVVCLECGKKLKTLRTHLRKAHGLLPKEYFRRFDLDSKKYPLVCKEYSEKRSKIAKSRDLGALGRKKKSSG